MKKTILLLAFLSAAVFVAACDCVPLPGQNNCLSMKKPPANAVCWPECDPGAPESGQTQGSCPAGEHEGTYCCPTSQPSCMPNTCIPETGNCNVSAQCCAGTCNHSSVDVGACVCATDGEKCVTDVDCCSYGHTSVCMAGACAPSACMPDESGCSTDLDCCSGHCSLNGCVP